MGLGYAFFEYRTVRGEIKASKSLEIIQSFYSENMIRNRLYLNQLMWRVITETKQESEAEQENVLAIYYHKINSFIENNSAAFEIINHYLHSLEFFAACTKDELCRMDEKSILHDLFMKQARQIYRGFHPFVCKLRENPRLSQQWRDLEEYLLSDQDEDDPEKLCDAYNPNLIDEKQLSK